MAKMVMALLALSTTSLGSQLSSKDAHILTVPMYSYKEQCFLKSGLSVKPAAAALLQHNNVPGAGINTFTPFQTVLKDGFMEVDCIKDYMYYHGDKFGDNKHDYELGASANVSIVHYDAFVAKVDRQPMTQVVCFEFCRTVPDMGFFGIVNGRGCYCTPYFKSMASDSSQCDSVCDGETTTMCGGKSKSSVFAMHMCSSTQSDLQASINRANSLKSAMTAKVKKATALSKDMQARAAALQKTFGAVGDSAATGLMQDAKVSAGKLGHSAGDTADAASVLDKLATAASNLNGFPDPAVVTSAERNIEDTEEALEAGELATTKLDKAIALASPSPVSKGAAAQYYPVMYFVNKKHRDVPTTCSGDSVQEPIVNATKDGCASACDRAVHSCVAYQYFGGGSKKTTQLCFLFSKLNTATYYTGCGSKSFLQMHQGAAPFNATCYGKFSKFDGLNLTPDPSGKNKLSLKKLNHANRCY